MEAYLDGVRLVAEWVRQPAIVESDCLTMIDALRQGTDCRRPGMGVLREIHAVCSLLPDFRLEAVKRDANVVAHDLVERARDA
jgi:hypothetical protein